MLTMMSHPRHKWAALLLFLALLLVGSNWNTAAADPPFRASEKPPTAETVLPSQVRSLYARLLGDFNCEQIAFYKTHKTGSTDLGAILFRVGVRHNKRFHTMTGVNHYLNASMKSKPADFIVNHSRSSLREMQSVYRKYLGGHPGRLTILRDPVTRYVSDFYYFVKPLHNSSVLGGSGEQPVRNRMTRDMLGEPAESLSLLADFFGSEEWQGTVFLRLERLAEGLAALHLHCGWPIKYLLNFNVNCAGCGRPLRRWDGLVVEPHGKVSAKLKERITALHQTDTMLVEAVESKWKEIRARGGEVLQAVEAEVKRQQALVEAFCRKENEEAKVRGDSGPRPACLWLSLSDLEYEKMVSRATGRVPVNATVRMDEYVHPGIPNIPMEDMIADYDRVYDQIVGPPRLPHDLHHRQDVAFPHRGHLKHRLGKMAGAASASDAAN